MRIIVFSFPLFSVKQFISYFPYEKYRKVYDTQQLEEKINKLEQITNQT